MHESDVSVNGPWSGRGVRGRCPPVELDITLSPSTTTTSAGHASLEDTSQLPSPGWSRSPYNHTFIRIGSPLPDLPTSVFVGCYDFAFMSASMKTHSTKFKHV